MIKVLLFDWGDTIMRDDLTLPGPMAYWEKVSWIPGLRDALHHTLSHKYICVVASNSGESDTPLMIKALQRIYADEYFYDFFTSYDIGCEKPDVRFFRFIADKMKVNPNECIMIGNNYQKDIEGAKNAGMFTIWFNEENKTQLNAAAADQTIHQMSELIVAINKIEHI